jgi:hypothetical protein
LTKADGGAIPGSSPEDMATLAPVDERQSQRWQVRSVLFFPIVLHRDEIGLGAEPGTPGRLGGTRRHHVGGQPLRCR